MKTEELCSLVDEWEIQQNGDLLNMFGLFLKEKGFFGLLLLKNLAAKALVPLLIHRL